MSRALPPDAAEAAAILAEHCGYLRSVIREPRVTCQVCATPVDGWDLCYPCKSHRESAFDVADRVGSVVYASRPAEQTYRVMRGYKAAQPPRAHSVVFALLTALAIRGHLECIETLNEDSDLVWAVVPSTSTPRPVHRLRQVVAGVMPVNCDEVVLRPLTGPWTSRELSRSAFELVGESVEGRNVLLVDDSWVRGAHAQSAAHTLRANGAASVSVLTIARVLDPGNWDESARFERNFLTPPYFEPERCPWTGGACPE